MQNGFGTAEIQSETPYEILKIKRADHSQISLNAVQNFNHNIPQWLGMGNL